MSGKKSVVFQYFSKEIQDILISENRTDEVANNLYQSKGVISLKDVLHIKSYVSEGEKAESLLNLLQQLILRDQSQFEKVVSILRSYSELKQVMERMEETMCEFH